MARKNDKARIALVLGSGGIVGGAFHAGVLKALLDTWDIDARSVETIIGTSAGAITGALTAAGVHPNDLFRRETGMTLSPAGTRLLNRARANRGPKPDPRTAMGQPLAPEALLNAMVEPRGVAFGSLAAAMLPRGKVPTGHVGGLIDGLLGTTWPKRPELRICAVQASTAKRVVFDEAGPATPGEAVASSCAVPAVFAPVTIGDHDYLDGGAHSADNLDVIGNSRYDLVVVSSPMGCRHRIDTSLTWGPIRTFSRWETEAQLRVLTGCGRVEIVRPDVKDLDAMGADLMDPERRPAVAVQANATAAAQFARHPRPFQEDR